MLARLSAQPKVHPTQVPAPGPPEMLNFPVPPLPVNGDLRHQQDEINRLSQIGQ